MQKDKIIGIAAKQHYQDRKKILIKTAATHLEVQDSQTAGKNSALSKVQKKKKTQPSNDNTSHSFQA